MVMNPNTGDKIYVDFRPANAPNTIAEFLGYNEALYASQTGVITTITGEYIPKFNSLNYYLIQSSLVNKGIRINSTYNNIIAKIKITAATNHQNIYEPTKPTTIHTSELIGDTRNQFTFSLLDSNLNFVDTKSELWSATLRLTYYTPP
jgi:hypothetical protein